jgi:hypothetical protein
VLLSANVFVAGLRAIAIALASSANVYVRPSRREPTMVDLLARAAPEQFRVVDEVRPCPGDHVWAYGHSNTLDQLRRTFAHEVVFHGHGSGYGVVIVEADELQDVTSLENLARAIVDDVVPFDQRGCLSPRVVLVQQDHQAARRLWQALAAAMLALEAQIPLGAISGDERAEILRYRDTLCVAGEVLNARSGLVSIETQPLPWILPPIGRVLHVRTTSDAVQDVLPRAHELTTIGANLSRTTRGTRLQRIFHKARVAQIGCMQRPKLDGPVDLRNLDGEVL